MIIFLLILFCVDNGLLGSNSNDAFFFTFKNPFCCFLTKNGLNNAKNDFITRSLPVTSQNNNEADLICADINNRIIQVDQKRIPSMNLFLKYLFNQKTLYLTQPAKITLRIVNMEALQNQAEYSKFLNNIFDVLFTKQLITVLAINLIEQGPASDIVSLIEKLKKENQSLSNELMYSTQQCYLLDDALAKREEITNKLVSKLNSKINDNDVLIEQVDTLANSHKELLKRYDDLLKKYNDLNNKK